MKAKLPYEERYREINGVKEKRCALCNNWFPANTDYYYKINGSTKDGLYSYCKKCASEKAANWLYAHRDKKNAFQKKIDARPDRRIYLKENSKRRREQGLQREWQRNNMDKCVEYSRKWLGHKSHNISKEELKELYNYCDSSCMYCGMSEENAKKKYGKKLFRDHFDNEGSNGIENCILCCQGCSSSKATKVFNDWYVETNPIYCVDRRNKVINWINKFKESK